MSTAPFTTKVSTRGRLTIPKAVRDESGWAPGTTLDIEVTRTGVLLKPEFPFPRSEPGAAFGILRYDGPRKTIEEMDQATTDEVRARHARGEY